MRITKHKECLRTDQWADAKNLIIRCYTLRAFFIISYIYQKLRKIRYKTKES